MGEHLRTEDNRAAYHFHHGTHTHAFDYLGIHREGNLAVFRVWAPNADFASVCGDFNQWDTESCPMKRVTMAGVWEARFPANRIREGSLYKFYLQVGDRGLYRADPYARCVGIPPETASVYSEEPLDPHNDEGWLHYRRVRFSGDAALEQPLNIYGLHLASFLRWEGKPLSYEELAREAVPYLKQMGYTHVELLIGEGEEPWRMESLYAPPARFGSPRAFSRMVDLFHEGGIGVLLGMSFASLPSSELADFDGTPIYEKQSPCGNQALLRLCREEVRSFLFSSTVFWVERYRVDGFVINELDRMISPAAGNTAEDCRCGRELLRAWNGMLAKSHPDIITVAEGGADMARLTGFAEGGFGFRFCRDNRWTEESLSYCSTDPLFRGHRHGALNYPITYAYNERFVLPVSTCRTARESGLWQRMWGDGRLKAAGARLLMLYHMTYVGKKSSFMGTELCMKCRWDPHGALPFDSVNDDTVSAFQYYTACLNRFYLRHDALWRREDAYGDGFAWIDPDNHCESVLSYRRIAPDGRELAVILNFTPVKREQFLVELPNGAAWQEILNSDAVEFGGEGCLNPSCLPTVATPGGHLLRLTLPPLGGVVLEKGVVFPKETF